MYLYAKERLCKEQRKVYIKIDHVRMYHVLVSGCIRIPIIEVKFNVCIQGPAACDIID